MMYGRGIGFGSSHMLGGGVFGAFLHAFFGILFIAGIVLLLVSLARHANRHGAAASGYVGHQQPPVMPMTSTLPDEAITVARRRLAEGEITAEQYKEIMGLLGS